MNDAGDPNRSLLPRLLARSRHNSRRTFAIIGRRFRARPAMYGRIAWWPWIGGVALLAAFAAAVLDQISVRNWYETFGASGEIFTQLGLGQWYLWPAAAWLLVANQIDWTSLRREQLMAVYNRTSIAMFVLVGVGVPGLLNIVLKIVFGRARPKLFAQEGPFSFHPFTVDAVYASFPSGHATTMGSVAGVLVLLFPRAKYPVLALCMAVAATRVVVGAHYPSDTIVGFGMGFGLAVAAGLVFARLGFLFRTVPRGLPALKRTVWCRAAGTAHIGQVARRPAAGGARQSNARKGV